MEALDVRVIMHDMQALNEKFLSIYLSKVYAVYNSKLCTLRLYGDVKSRY